MIPSVGLIAIMTVCELSKVGTNDRMHEIILIYYTSGIFSCKLNLATISEYQNPLKINGS